MLTAVGRGWTEICLVAYDTYALLISLGMHTSSICAIHERLIGALIAGIWIQSDYNAGGLQYANERLFRMNYSNTAAYCIVYAYSSSAWRTELDIVCNIASSQNRKDCNIHIYDVD